MNMSRKSTASDPLRSGGSFPRGQNSRSVKLTALLSTAGFQHVQCFMFPVCLHVMNSEVYWCVHDVGKLCEVPEERLG